MTARISRVEFEQVITNLVRNAVDACTETMDAEPTLHIRLRQTPAATVVCTVSDNGHGIPANQVPLLFEPYFTTKSPDRGTGLGLFVVNSVVRKAGGAVSVDSTAGRGTTIEFSLPLA